MSVQDSLWWHRGLGTTESESLSPDTSHDIAWLLLLQLNPALSLLQQQREKSHHWCSSTSVHPALLPVPPPASSLAFFIFHPGFHSCSWSLDLLHIHHSLTSCSAVSSGASTYAPSYTELSSFLCKSLQSWNILLTVAEKGSSSLQQKRESETVKSVHESSWPAETCIKLWS